VLCYLETVNIPETYNYLVRTRQDLWRTLERVPDEVLSRAILSGSRFHCIKDLLFHIPDVEDGWINGDIRQMQMVQNTIPVLKNSEGGPVYTDFSLDTLLDYWRLVEQSTLAYLAALNDEELSRIVPVEDWPEKRFTVDGLLWHVMIHEMRHTSQIAVLLRTQDIEPPPLDLLFYLQ
jgi:uncharacterized damage-inducible protein DinB